MLKIILGVCNNPCATFSLPIIFVLNSSWVLLSNRKRKRKQCLCIFLYKCILGNVKMVNLTFHFYYKTKVLKFNNVFVCKRLHIIFVGFGLGPNYNDQKRKFMKTKVPYSETHLNVESLENAVSRFIVKGQNQDFGNADVITANFA